MLEEDIFDKNIKKKGTTKKRVFLEEILHKHILDFIAETYPDVEYNTDMAGLRLPKGQAMKAKTLRSGNGFPDISILKTKKENDIIIKAGLFLEVKKETPYKTNGALKTKDGLFMQNEKHEKLRAEGYEVHFVWTLEQAKLIINKYINHE